MAITKLRLKQAQAEVDEFSVGGSFSAIANPGDTNDTLHQMMSNLAVSMEKRFGKGQNVKSAISNMLNVEHEEGVVAHFDSTAAPVLLLRNQSTANPIKLEAGQHVKIEAAQELSGAADKIFLDSLQETVLNNGKYEAYSQSSIEMYAKAASLYQVNGANNKIETVVAGNIWLNSAEAIDGDAVGAITFDAGAAISLDAASSSNFSTSAGDLALSAFALMDIDGDDVDIDAIKEVTIDSGTDTTLTAVGSMSLAGGADSDFVSGGKLTFTATAEYKAEGSILELDATGTYMGFEDGYRVNSTGKAAGWSYGGIKLADSATDWDKFHDAFGEVSLLKAVTDAALGGTSDAADYVLVMEGSETSGTKMSAVTIATAGNRQVIDDASGSVAHTLAVINCTGYTANEALRQVSIFVNGQKLISGSDYSLNYLNETIDPQFTFDLEKDDVVVIEVG